MPEPLRLDVGCYGHPRPGFVGIDRKQGGEAFPLRFNDGSPVPDASVDCMVCSHILEHFSHRDTAVVLAEWVRVLKPGGILRIAVPDFGWIAERYLDGADLPFVGWLFGGHEDENDHHGNAFDEECLCIYLEQAGLGDFRKWESDQGDCSSLECSLNIQARKPGGPPLPEPEAAKPVETELPPVPKIPAGQVAACLSLPRLAFTDNLFCAYASAFYHDLPLERSTSAFWCQGLSSLMERAIERGAPYILTLDYDTVFTPADVRALYDLMERNPEVGAACAVQMRRAGSGLLLSVSGEDLRDGPKEIRVLREDLDAECFPIATGHFGLTLIRASVLEQMERPWFLAVPGEDGGWGAGHLDADISFWRKFQKVGQLVLSCRVVVGHLEHTVTWPDRDLKPMHQWCNEYHEKGRPARAWR